MTQKYSDIYKPHRIRIVGILKKLSLQNAFSEEIA